MRLRPPTSTLFPYTTLFRSGDDGRISAFVRSITDPGALADTVGYSPDFTFEQKVELLEDRKSTRLNSSHSQISYAVFCLKKKDATSHIRCFDAQIRDQTRVN